MSRKRLEAVRFGARMREARIDAGLEQQDLAKRVGVHFTVISGWETGKAFPRKENYDRLVKELGDLGLDPEKLQGGAGWKRRPVALKQEEKPTSALSSASCFNELIDLCRTFGYPQVEAAFDQLKNMVDAIRR